MYALLASALVHGVGLFLYSRLVRRDAPPPVAVTVPREARPEGTEIVRLLEVAEAPEPTVAPLPDPAPVPPAVVQPPAPPEPPAVPPVELPVTPPVVVTPPATLSRSAVDRLRPGEVDARLWTLAPEATRLSPAELAQLRVVWMILDISDSTAAAAAAARRLTDWTYTDADGGKWGVSEGMIHLGDLSLPLPFFFGSVLSDDASRANWLDAEIARSAGSAAARANLNERIRAIRERLERERSGQPPDTARGPSR